jgi:hypothetical protein
MNIGFSLVTIFFFYPLQILDFVEFLKLISYYQSYFAILVPNSSVTAFSVRFFLFCVLRQSLAMLAQVGLELRSSCLCLPPAILKMIT